MEQVCFSYCSTLKCNYITNCFINCYYIFFKAVTVMFFLQHSILWSFSLYYVMFFLQHSILYIFFL